MSDQTRKPSPEYQLYSRKVSPSQGSVGAIGDSGQTLGAQECPNCGAENHAGASICHACGEQLRQRPKTIRCRQCGQRASSNLTICPHCGRELHAAPSRILTWVVPVVLVLLFLIFLLSRLDGGPVAWSQDQLGRGAAWISGMGEEMAPDVLVEMTPSTDVAAETGPEVNVGADAPVDTVALAVDDAAIPPDDTGDQGSESMAEEGSTFPQRPIDAPAAEPTATPIPPTETSTPEPTATPTESTTEAPTETPTTASTPEPTAKATLAQTPSAAATESKSEAVIILQPTATPEQTTDETATAASIALVPTNTPTPISQEYTVRAGDTLLGIASRFAVTVDELMAANDIAPGEVYALRVGESLVIPPSDGQGGPATQTYTVRAGDTFLAIANRFDLTVNELQIANGLTDDEVRLLRPGQELIIPTGESAVGSEVGSTVAVVSTATEAPTTISIATPVPTSTEPALRLDAPRLRSPENNTFISCTGSDQLAWEGVNFILPTDEYVLHLGFVNGIDGAGNEEIIWVLRQARPPGRTSWEVDNDLCGLAPQEYGRQWRWYVDVVDESAQTVSRPSETWGFSWN